MPRRARRSAFSSDRSSPLNTIVPPRSGRRPISAFINVLLPTPLRPRTATISPRATSMSTPRSTSPAPYPARKFVAFSSSVTLPPSEIYVADVLALAHLAESSIGEDASLMQNRHALRNLSDKSHVVLDDQ